jgi:hypothetical protein
MKRQDFCKLFVMGVLSMLLLFSFTACGGGKAVKSDESAGTAQKTAAETSLGKRYDVIFFQKFEADPKIETDYPGAVAECETNAISELRSKNFFRKVEKEGAGGRYEGQTLLVQPKVLSLRIVSGAARFWGGAFAGTSDMVVELKMTDAVSGKLIHEKVLSTANNPFAAAWVWGSSDRSLPADMGKIISEYIVSVMPAR